LQKAAEGIASGLPEEHSVSLRRRAIQNVTNWYDPEARAQPMQKKAATAGLPTKGKLNDRR
jgi:hypothetical protein